MKNRKRWIGCVTLLALAVIGLATLWIKRAEVFESLEEGCELFKGIGEESCAAEEWVPHALLPAPSPTPGPSPTPDPKIYAVEIQSQKEQEKVDQRVQALFRSTEYYTEFKIDNPVFKRVFPRASMYAVTSAYTGIGSRRARADHTMVSLGDKDYRMPDQFNQLMFDAGYKLDKETLEKLAHALVITAVPTGVAAQQITCEPLKEIYEEHRSTPPDVYKVRCALESIDIVLKLEEPHGYFPCGSLDILDKNGEEIMGRTVCPH